MNNDMQRSMIRIDPDSQTAVIQKRILVTGAGGFIGGHLVKALRALGHLVRAVDWKEHEFFDMRKEASEWMVRDLRDEKNCLEVTRGIDEVYQLAADMGGMGFIQNPDNQYLIAKNSGLINRHMLDASIKNGVKKYLFSSSACIYPEYKQTEVTCDSLKESDAYPAQPQDSYGWEKLEAEHMCKYARRWLDTKVVRFHNIYGPNGTWQGGREKAPAALSRKIASAILSGKAIIDVWGDGEQTRSFCHIKDCVKGMQLIMAGENQEPVNLGRDEMTSINDFAQQIWNIATDENAWKKHAWAPLLINHVDGVQGVRGRNSDNTMFKEIYGWEPEISLEEGMKDTYEWIKGEVIKNGQ